jgi:hypothetical protein
VRWAKLRRALADRRSLAFLDRMQRQLAAPESGMAQIFKMLIPQAAKAIEAQKAGEAEAAK